MDDLLIKYLLGEATPEETARVERWLGADQANRARLEQFRAVWGLGRRLATEEAAAVDRGEAWSAVSQKLENGPTRASGRAADGMIRRVPVVRMPVRWAAAAVIGMLAIGAGGYALLRHERGVQPSIEVGKVGKVGKKTEHTQAAAPAERPVPELNWVATVRPRTDTLPDGSVVTLNKGGRMAIIGKDTNRAVRVQLEGEGFFSVRHDPARAFVVEVNDMTVSVLGTSFELDGRNGDSIAVVVETGAVSVSGRNGDRLVVRAGQRASLVRGGHWKRERSGDKLYGYYLGRPLVCDSIPLRRLVAVLNEAYDAHISFGREELGGLPLTTTFRGESLDRILKIVASTFDLSIVRAGPKIIIQ
jgi:transmembrane sensor